MIVWVSEIQGVDTLVHLLSKGLTKKVLFEWRFLKCKVQESLSVKHSNISM